MYVLRVVSFPRLYARLSPEFAADPPELLNSPQPVILEAN